MLILRYRFDYNGNSNTRYASCFDRVYVATEIGATNAFAICKQPVPVLFGMSTAARYSIWKYKKKYYEELIKCLLL
jgi:hypothetical protein